MEQTKGPARLVPPGRIIARELEARGWQQRDLAEIVGRPEQAISEVVNGKKRITSETARELAAAFGTSVDFWINLEAAYRLHLIQRQEHEQNITRRARLHILVPYGELVRRGWIEDHASLDDQEREVCRYLDIASLDEEPRLALAARHSAHGQPEQVALVAWARRVEHLAAQQVVGAFDPARLRETVAALLDLTQEPEGVGRVPQRLLAAGVHFCVVPHLPHTYLDGAALHADGHPIVALTLHYDRLDSFWFTLMHELAHLALGHEGAYFDRLDDARILTEAERQADALAQDWLLEPAAYADFVARGIFIPAAIRQFAGQQRRHPATVVGRLQHDRLLEYTRFAALRVRVREVLDSWIDEENGE